MRLVRRLRVRDVRTYDSAEVTLGPRLTIVHGPNGAGKTNLLEALYVGLHRALLPHRQRPRGHPLRCARRCGSRWTSRPRTASTSWRSATSPRSRARVTADGAPVERILDVGFRPLVSVFLPDRLELVKGAPAGPARTPGPGRRGAVAGARRRPPRLRPGARAAQRAARRGCARAATSSSSLHTWDLELGRLALALRDDRARAAELIAPGVAEIAAELGLAGETELRYRPRTRAATAEEFAAELAERLDSDLARGFTGHGPHRDDLVLSRDGRELRAYGSQGEQRLALLALLLAERDVARRRPRGPAAAAARRRDERARRRAPRACSSRASRASARSSSRPPTSPTCPTPTARAWCAWRSSRGVVRQEARGGMSAGRRQPRAGR